MLLLDWVLLINIRVHFEWNPSPEGRAIVSLPKDLLPVPGCQRAEPGPLWLLTTNGFYILQSGSYTRIIKSPRYTGGDFMFLYRYVRCRHRWRRSCRPQILVHTITFEQLFLFFSINHFFSDSDRVTSDVRVPSTHLV